MITQTRFARFRQRETEIEDLTIVSNDSVFDAYGVSRLW